MDQNKRIYLKRETIRLGFGSTSRDTVIENYFQVEEAVEVNRVSIRLLNISDQPFGEPTLITRDELEQDYAPCPDYFKNKKNPKAQLAEKHVELGEAHYENRQFFSAEREFNNALALNEKDLKANLGKGKSLYARGEKKKAKEIFDQLSQMDDLYEKENKHIFNEFGIELRKRNLHDEAVSNYTKAIAIDPGDPVLYYNLGRAYYEKKDREESIEQLTKALTLKEDFKEARDFMNTLTGGQSFQKSKAAEPRPGGKHSGPEPRTAG
jgi:tetratricopeptide (TPR) repeat protein